MAAHSAVAAVDSAVAEVERLASSLKRNKHAQVRANDERLAIKATALTWFQSHKPLLNLPDDTALQAVDASYMRLLEASATHATRSKYLSELKALKRQLILLRTACLSQGSDPVGDAPPDFSRLVVDPAMQKILVARWAECTNCMRANAPLAATVMMGGLLEGLLLARINRESNKATIFTAKTAPREKNGKTKPLSGWFLNDFISVAHELGWITVSAKDIGHVLRDYRNYIHPQKQLSENVSLGPEDAALFWDISKGISRQLLK